MKETSGTKKLIRFFALNPDTLIEPSQLEVISGIRDWTRTLRMIREKEGLNIAWFPKSEKHPNGGYMLITKK